MQHDEFEEALLAESRLEGLRAGRGGTTPLSEVMDEYELKIELHGAALGTDRCPGPLCAGLRDQSATRNSFCPVTRAIVSKSLSQ